MANIASITSPRAPVVADIKRPTYSILMLFPCHVLTDHLPYGDGLIAYGFIAELARRGHRVHVLAHHVNVHGSFPSNVEICEMSTDPEASIMDRVRFIIKSRALLRRLRRLRSVDLIHQLNPVCTGMIAGMLGSRVPLILGTFVAYWPHGVWPPIDPDRRTTWYDPLKAAGVRCLQALAKRMQEQVASAFLVTSSAALGRFTSERSVKARVFPLRHGVDASYFRPLPGPERTTPTVLFFAGLAERKGIFTLLEAFELVAAKLPDARLLIAGTGPALDEVNRRLGQMRSADRVEMVGKVPRSEVPELMVRGDVYCLPSYGEPYATTVIEAMACGKAVVVTDGGGLRDIIDDQGGRCVRPRDASELATALIEILISPKLATQMGAHNRLTVERHYDWPRVVDQLEDVYSTVLERSSARAR